MKFTSLQPFVPSGKDMEKSKELFIALGFIKEWDNGNYAGFQKDSCRFILQRFDNQQFAENFMLSVGVDNVQAYREFILASRLEERFGIRVGNITPQPYGKELNVIDLAGVCWHFVQEGI